MRKELCHYHRKTYSNLWLNVTYAHPLKEKQAFRRFCRSNTGKLRLRCIKKKTSVRIHPLSEIPINQFYGALSIISFGGFREYGNTTVVVAVSPDADKNQ